MSKKTIEPPPAWRRVEPLVGRAAVVLLFIRGGNETVESMRTYHSVPRCGDWIVAPTEERDDGLGSDTAVVSNVILISQPSDRDAEVFCDRVWELL